MGTSDKIKNAAQEASGKVKETTGDVTNNPDLEAQGQREQTEANVKQAAEDVKDTLR